MPLFKYTRRDFLKALGLGAMAFAIPGCNDDEDGSSDDFILADESDIKITSKYFTIVVLPDTQIYSQKYPEIFKSQTNWIKQQKDNSNIVCVIHEGDITQTNVEKEWIIANEAMSVLDGVIPYFVTTGNHDMGTLGLATTRDTRWFNKYFPISRFENTPEYGGHFGENIENAYYLMHARKLRLMILCLEFGPRDEVLDWANQVVSSHNKYRTIVNTHCYMDHDDTRVGKGDADNPHLFPIKANDGEEIWEKFVRKHENIFLVVSGHVRGDGLGRQTSTGDHGNKVHEILANYQVREKGGNGWLRLMKFVLEKNKLVVQTYSPYLRKYAIGKRNEFVLDYDMS